MKVGFTGTERGMTRGQRAALERFLVDLARAPTLLQHEFHHGDCVGSDAEAHDLAWVVGYRIVIHPPVDGKLRAWKTGGLTLPAKPYMERNLDIAWACECLVATPDTEHEVLRSGTWATVRRARALGRTITVIGPDGTARPDVPWKPSHGAQFKKHKGRTPG